MKKISLILIIAISAFLLFGCKSAEQKQVEASREAGINEVESLVRDLDYDFEYFTCKCKQQKNQLFVFIS